MATRRFPSFGSLRALAALRQRSHLAGSMWLSVVDRDLYRVTSDLLYLSQSADAPSRGAYGGTRQASKPVDLHDRRTRAARPTNLTPRSTPSSTGSHARAS